MSKKDKIIAKMREEIKELQAELEYQKASAWRDYHEQYAKRTLWQARYHDLRAKMAMAEHRDAEISVRNDENTLIEIINKNAKPSNGDPASLCGWSASPWGDEDDDLVNTPADTQDGEK